MLNKLLTKTDTNKLGNHPNVTLKREKGQARVETFFRHNKEFKINVIYLDI